MEELKVGDGVKIADDSPLARWVLKTAMAYTDYKCQLLGKYGTVSAGPSENGYCMVYVDENEYSMFFPTVLLEKLPAEECENIHRVQGDAVGDAFRKAMLIACGEVKYDFDSVEAACDFMKSMEAVAKVATTKPCVAEIVFDHVVRDGKCMLQIAEFSNILGGDDLPKEYSWDADPNRVLLSAGPGCFI